MYYFRLRVFPDLINLEQEINPLYWADVFESFEQNAREGREVDTKTLHEPSQVRLSTMSSLPSSVMPVATEMSEDEQATVTLEELVVQAEDEGIEPETVYVEVVDKSSRDIKYTDLLCPESLSQFDEVPGSTHELCTPSRKRSGCGSDHPVCTVTSETVSIQCGYHTPEGAPVVPDNANSVRSKRARQLPSPTIVVRRRGSRRAIASSIHSAKSMERRKKVADRKRARKASIEQLLAVFND